MPGATLIDTKTFATASRGSLCQCYVHRYGAPEALTGMQPGQVEIAYRPRASLICRKVRLSGLEARSLVEARIVFATERPMVFAPQSAL